MATLNAGNWVERVAGEAAQFETRGRGKTLSIDVTTILGQTEKGAWIVRLDGHEGNGISWRKVTHFLAISGSEAWPSIDEATPEQIAQVNSQKE